MGLLHSVWIGDMWQHRNRATPGYFSDITTSWRLKVLARYLELVTEIVLEAGSPFIGRKLSGYQIKGIAENLNRNQVVINQGIERVKGKLRVGKGFAQPMISVEQKPLSKILAANYVFTCA